MKKSVRLATLQIQQISIIDPRVFGIVRLLAIADFGVVVGEVTGEIET